MLYIIYIYNHKITDCDTWNRFASNTTADCHSGSTPQFGQRLVGSFVSDVSIMVMYNDLSVVSQSNLLSSTCSLDIDQNILPGRETIQCDSIIQWYHGGGKLKHSTYWHLQLVFTCLSMSYQFLSWNLVGGSCHDGGCYTFVGCSVAGSHQGLIWTVVLYLLVPVQVDKEKVIVERMQARKNIRPVAVW